MKITHREKNRIKKLHESYRRWNGSLIKEDEGKVNWDNIAKEVANRLKGGSWPWAIKKGVENITPEVVGSVLIAGGYTTNSGVEKNIGGIVDKVLALVKEEDNEYQTFSLKLRPWVTATPDDLEHILAAALNIHSSEVARKHNIESDVIVEPMKVQGPYEFSMNEVDLPTVRREDSDRLRRKPYSAKARFRAGLGKSL